MLGLRSALGILADPQVEGLSVGVVAGAQISPYSGATVSDTIGCRLVSGAVAAFEKSRQTTCWSLRICQHEGWAGRDISHSLSAFLVREEDRPKWVN
jgi:hypothetical protein